MGARPDVGTARVATNNSAIVPATLADVQAGKHVLVEKPAALNAAELQPVIEAAERNNVRVRVGFNHRYHPALLKAREIIETGDLGALMFIRGRYGHGGRIGYDREWRGAPAPSDAGSLSSHAAHLSARS